MKRLKKTAINYDELYTLMVSKCPVVIQYDFNMFKI